MEARLYAEDPAHGFLPSIGALEHFRLPVEAVRVDTGVEEGGEVSQFYDPMIAKLIAHGDSREEAAAQLADACREVEVWPVRTNAAFLARCLDHPDFLAGEVDTGFIGARQEALTKAPPSPDAVTAALALAAEHAAAEVGLPVDGDRFSPWQATPDGLYGFRLNGPGRTAHRVEINGEPAEGDARPLLPGEWRWLVGAEGRLEEAAVLHEQVVVGERRALGFVRTEAGAVLFDHGAALELREVETKSAPAAAAQSDGSLRAPMPGRIVAVPAEAGQPIARGCPVVVLEAMKMEHALVAPFDGVVVELPVRPGDQVTEGALLAKVCPPE
jgi:propionyl-CoA carboxylase alpha chain/3-methylcrotonyl-CoA carboxylase alpha subunit